jgi:hypothetical protein
MNRIALLSIGLLILILGLESCSTLAKTEQERIQRIEAETQERRQAREDQKKFELDLKTAAVHLLRTTPAPTVAPPFDPLGGLVFKMMPQTIRVKDDYEYVVMNYAAFADSLDYVLSQVRAFGLRDQLAVVQRVRRAALSWQEFYQGFQFFPEEPVLQRAELEFFYELVASYDRRIQQVLVELNQVVDRQRSKPWSDR